MNILYCNDRVIFFILFNSEYTFSYKKWLKVNYATMVVFIVSFERFKVEIITRVVCGSDNPRPQQLIIRNFTTVYRL